MANKKSETNIHIEMNLHIVYFSFVGKGQHVLRVLAWVRATDHERLRNVDLVSSPENNHGFN